MESFAFRNLTTKPVIIYTCLLYTSNFKKELNTASTGLFGSGWAWLSVDKQGKLHITKEPNGSNPWRAGLKPLLGFDCLLYTSLTHEIMNTIAPIVSLSQTLSLRPGTDEKMCIRDSV